VGSKKPGRAGAATAEASGGYAKGAKIRTWCTAYIAAPTEHLNDYPCVIEPASDFYETRCWRAEENRGRRRDAMARVNPIPEGCHSVQPYLMFSECAKAMEFYTAAFGAREVMCMKGPDGRVGHAEMQIGDSRIMMADEAPQMEAYAVKHYGGSPVALMLYTEDCDAVYARALAAGGKSVREPADQPYGDRMGGIVDPFGYKWWIGTHIKDMAIAEIADAVNATPGTV
jgi:PhnB protein